jgi:putative ABC transport system permease protein
VVSLLDRKLLRDVLGMRGQVITIAALVASGVAVFVASVSTYDSLRAARDRFYSETRFPQIFVMMKRAPLSIVAQLNEIPGVAIVEPRIVRDVIVDWPASTLPVSARMVSVSSAGDERLARLHLSRGAAPMPGDAHGAAIDEAFAEANHLTLGSDVRVLLNGREQSFHVTGAALSSEFVYAVKPGLPVPDDRSYAILWIDRSAAEAAFDMKGAFNDAIVSLAPGADPNGVIADLDRLLGAYGSTGALERRDQPSNRFLEDEISQQKMMSVTIPFIFFGVAAFLLNVTLGRIVTAQSEQIATLKALGFPSTPIVAHYLKLVALIVFIGWVFGLAGGFAFGQAMIASYHGFFRLPKLEFAMTPWAAFFAGAISFAAASIGVLTAIKKVVGTAPAIAMQPAAPLRFQHSWIEGLWGSLSLRPRSIMMLRNIVGRPVRAALTIAGVASAVPMVALGLFWRDAIEQMIDVQFNLVERGNATLAFLHPFDRSIINDLRREPGVLVVEGQRGLPVRLRAGQRSYLTSLTGLSPHAELTRPHDAKLRPIELPPFGVAMSQRLAERLGVSLGENITVEALEGKRKKLDLPVSATVDEAIGMASYVDLDALNRLTGEGDVVSQAAIYADPSLLPALSQRLKQLPVVESVAMKALTLTSFLERIAGLVLVSSGVLTLFAVVIAVGVVYNGARIGLQERARELASLRVLGFTRGEVARVLFGQFAVEIAIGIPIGLALSRAIIDLLSRLQSNESFQIPAVIEPRTYAAAAFVVVAAAVVSAYIVRRRIDRLDLVAVLKTRD